MQNPKQPFSQQLKNWLQSSVPKTAHELDKVFGERSFAVLILVFMSPAALPLPTGGITHVLEIICMFICVELILGFKSFWLPNKLKHRQLPAALITKALPLLMRRIEWVESYSKSTFGTGLLGKKWFIRLSGITMLGGIVAAFLAPPFSGLDTLPALGVVSIALAIIVGNMILYIAGVMIAIIGITLGLTFGAAIFAAGKKFIVHGSTDSRLIALGVILVLFVLVVWHFKKPSKK